jgi:hypothetical protein
MKDRLVAWLLAGDVSIQYQVHRDLLDSERPDLRRRIQGEGWGARFLSRGHPDGHWGKSFYQPKWTSTHYTILDLKNLGISPDHEGLRQSVAKVFSEHKSPDGGISPLLSKTQSDVCIDGMALNYAAYFGMPQADLESVVDFLLNEHMDDGGYNCRSNRGNPVHSSLHTTISVLEGIFEYETNGYRYRIAELEEQAKRAEEFILKHRLFRSDRTGEIIDKRYLLLSYPSRWRYDILRSLDYFTSAGSKYDPRMQDAIEIVLKKRRKDGRWPVQGRHAGRTHFEMEKTGGSSRWNTLRALRVLRHFGLK